MTDIMKLATDYAQACYHLANPESYDAERAEEARAALQSAIEALQKEVSTLDVLLEECKMDWSGDVTQLKAEHKREIDAMQSKLGDAIQSSAHWQHQFTEAQAENDLLKGYRDRALELATAYNNAQENIEQINAHREHILAVNEKLTAQVDAMGKGEPVQYQYRDARDDGTWSAWVGCDKPLHPNTWRQVRELYAEPKALAPLSRDDVKRICAEADYTHESAQSKADFINGLRHGEKAHGIGGTP